jgi:hypothetical protein
MRENAMKVYRIDYRYTGNGSMCITAESPKEASGRVRHHPHETAWQGALRTV